MKTILSSGHGLHVSGASHFIDEVTEARKVVNKVDEICELIKPYEVITFHENNAHNKTDNVKNIVSFHNRCNRTLDISLHFNAYKPTNSEMGIEILYTSENGKKYASQLLDKLVNVSGFKNRGVKKRSDLYFLNNTNKPAILIELCFVDSLEDINKYKEKFDSICETIAEFICEKEYTKKEKTYRVVTNTYSNIDNARNEVKKLEEMGLKPFIHITEG